MVSSIERYRQYFRENGFLVGTMLGVHKILASVHPACGLYWYYFYQQPLSGKSLLREGGNLSFLWLDHYDALLQQLPRPQANLQARFEQNARCLVALKNEELVACAWFAFSPYHEDEVGCAYLFASTAVWDFDVYVTPSYRIGRVFARTWQEANAKLSSEGYQSSLSRISAYNMQSIRSHERLGANRIGAALFLRLGGLQVMLSSLRPFGAVSVAGRGFPTLDFSTTVLSVDSEC